MRQMQKFTLTGDLRGRRKKLRRPFLHQEISHSLYVRVRVAFSKVFLLHIVISCSYIVFLMREC